MENMAVPGVDVKAEVKVDLTPAVKAGADIATNTHKGVSKLVYALCGPWMEGRIRKTELIAAQTSKDCADIKNGLVTYTGENVIPFEPQATVASSFEALHKLNHASDAKRLHAAMQEAARQISEVPEEQVSDEPLSQDFFNHWRREAEMIDDETLRKWWAGLLVEEAKKPQSVSPRTLDVARNLSKEEAELFEVMLKGVIGGTIPVLNGCPQFVNYAKLLLMVDAGLLVGGEVAQEWKRKSTDAYGIPINLGASEYVFCVDGELFRFSCYALTTAGRQLANIVGRSRSLEDVVGIVKFLHGGAKDRRFSIHRIARVEPDRSGWFHPEPEWTTAHV